MMQYSELTFRLSIALMAVFNAGEIRDGSGGSLPDRTMPMSSSCVWAVAKGDLMVS